MTDNLFRDTEPQVMTTKASRPLEGRVFVWAWTQWFERIEGEWGDVAFVPIAISEEELRELLSESAGHRVELAEVTGSVAKTVEEEFLDQAPLYPESAEVFDEVVDGPAGEDDFEHR